MLRNLKAEQCLKITEGVTPKRIAFIEADEGTLLEFQNFKQETCDPITILGEEIYPMDATLEQYLMWAYDIEILQEDLVFDTTFEEITQ